MQFTLLSVAALIGLSQALALNNPLTKRDPKCYSGPKAPVAVNEIQDCIAKMQEKRKFYLTYLHPDKPAVTNNPFSRVGRL